MLQTKGILAACIVTLIVAGLTATLVPEASCGACRFVAGGALTRYDYPAETDDSKIEGTATAFEPAALDPDPSVNDDVVLGHIFAKDETLTRYPVLKHAIAGADQDIRSEKGQLFFKQFQTGANIITEAQVEVRALKLIEGVYGGYRKGTNIILVHQALVEQANRGDKKAQENLEATLVHEFAHWADSQIKGGADTPGEEGKAAERAIYGYNKNLFNVSGRPNKPYDPPSKLDDAR